MNLQKVRAYKNPGVIARLQRELGLSEEDAENLFEDVKGFLYLSSLSKGPISPTKKLDAGWHEFILFTRDYADFCMQCVGHFVHHVPTDVSISSQYLSHTIALAREHLGVSSENWVGDTSICDDDDACGAGFHGSTENAADCADISLAKCSSCSSDCGVEPEPKPKNAAICEAWPPQPKPEMVAQHHQHA